MGIQMKKFTAASGRDVLAADDGSLMFGKALGYLSREATFDAEEYFQAKRDADLGRWRWAANPEYIVYGAKTPVGEPTDGTVVVIHEPSGDRLWADPDGAWSGEGATAHHMKDAAEAYFEEHPFTPTPWRDAKPGEVWTLDVDGETYAAVREYGRDFKLSSTNLLSPGDDRITGGRRLWPEDAA